MVLQFEAAADGEVKWLLLGQRLVMAFATAWLVLTLIWRYSRPSTYFFENQNDLLWRDTVVALVFTLGCLAVLALFVLRLLWVRGQPGSSWTRRRWRLCTLALLQLLAQLGACVFWATPNIRLLIDFCEGLSAATALLDALSAWKPLRGRLPPSVLARLLSRLPLSSRWLD